MKKIISYILVFLAVMVIYWFGVYLYAFKFVRGLNLVLNYGVSIFISVFALWIYESFNKN